MTKRQRQNLIRIILSAVLMAVALLVPMAEWLRFAIFFIAYAVVGYDVLWGALRNIIGGELFGEDFLMSIATIGAFAVGEYAEGVLVMLLYQIGELFQSYAVGKSRKSIVSLMDLRPDYANIMEDGTLTQIDPDLVEVGQEIVVKAGEKVPLDGVVVEGSSYLDTAALTGESVPREVKPGSEVLSGAVNMNSMLTIRTTKLFGESTAAKILDMVENVGGRKTKTEDFITKFARYYTPAVVAAAVLLAVIPPLFTGWDTFSMWLHRALTFLVVSCPCALVISVPLSYFGGIGGASKEGILIKGSSYLEALSQMNIAVFDKTGTLTKGTFTVTEIVPANGSSQTQILEYATLAEWYSDHPISASLKRAYGKEIEESRITSTEEISGKGVKVTADGTIILAGNAKLMQENDIAYTPATKPGTTVYVAVNGVYQGYILISDEIKDSTPSALAALKQQGVRTVMLTGDTQAVGDYVAGEIGIDEVYGNLLPMDKVDKVEELLAQKGSKGALAFVGDGINDAPVLTRADIGVAMGLAGRDAAIEAADVVLMQDDLAKLSKGMRISKRTSRIVKQNIAFALAVKAVTLVLSALGLTDMLVAVFADVGVMILAVLNALRTLRVKNI